MSWVESARWFCWFQIITDGRFQQPQRHSHSWQITWRVACCRWKFWHSNSDTEVWLSCILAAPFCMPGGSTSYMRLCRQEFLVGQIVLVETALEAGVPLVIQCRTQSVTKALNNLYVRTDCLCEVPSGQAPSGSTVLAAWARCPCHIPPLSAPLSPSSCPFAPLPLCPPCSFVPPAQLCPPWALSSPVYGIYLRQSTRSLAGQLTTRV